MLKEQIENYKPYNEQEETDKKVILSYLKNFSNILERENQYGHFTSTAWVTNKERNKVLMVYHNLYKVWTLPGGHAEGEEDLLKVAIREVEEETGIKRIKKLKEDIFSIGIVTANGHMRNGKYVSSHVHLDVVYLLEADETETLRIQPSENSEVKWISLEDLEKESIATWMKENIYKKLNEKLKKEK